MVSFLYMTRWCAETSFQGELSSTSFYRDNGLCLYISRRSELLYYPCFSYAVYYMRVLESEMYVFLVECREDNNVLFRFSTGLKIYINNAFYIKVLCK